MGTIKDKLNKQEQVLLASERETEILRKNWFRCSGLPLCPVGWCLMKLLYPNGAPEVESFSLSWFAGLGTTAHSALQKWDGWNGHIYGDWKCVHVKRKVIHGKSWKREHVVRVKNKVGPVFCPKCGRLMQYEELLVRSPNGELTGHVDALVPFKDGFYVKDYKTSSKFKCKEMKKPPGNYVEQVNAYAYMLSKFGPWDEQEKKFRKKLKIYGTIIEFIQRDNPFEKSYGIKQFLNKGFDEDVYLENMRLYKIAERALKTGKFKKVSRLGICSSREDAEGCEFASIGCPNKDKILASLKEAYSERD